MTDPETPDPATPAVPGGGDDAELTLAELSGGLRDLAGRVDDIEDSVAGSDDELGELREDLAALGQVVADLVKKDQTPIEPLPWAARASSADWEALCDWVDWLNGSYEFITASIPACWPAHAGVVEELAGLWRAWIEATVADTRAKRAGSSALTAWHDRWLWSTVNRFVRDHYLIKNCTYTHESRQSVAVPTDRSRVPEVRA